MEILELIIQELIKSRVKTRVGLDFFKRQVSKKYKIPCPSNIELLKAYHKLIKNKTLLRPAPTKALAGKQTYGGRGNKIFENLERLLRTRPVRSLSGIVNVSVLTKPYPCPGKCLYCPLEKGIPKSYVSGEPAVERAKRLNYNPYLQVKKRIEMLKLEGHPTDKIELRIVGGTWSFYPKKYQTWFISRCFQAANQNSTNYTMVKNVLLEGLGKEQKKNEKAKHRIVGLSIETRPDFINVSEIKHLRELGATMVELGVQSIYDDVLKFNLRGHGIKETILATKLLKDAGFKVLYQMMPDLPGSNLKRDGKMFEELFSNSNYQPDLLKIYPCALLKEAPLYKLWQGGQYRPYAKNQLINLIKSIKKKIPCYARIQRITRDIPSQRVISGGANVLNLRQILAEEVKKEGWKCKCIRCREVREEYDPKEKIYLFREDYDASGGREIFLSFENKNREKLYSLLRLRIPSSISKLAENGSLPIFPILRNATIIREIHTYGQLVPIKYIGDTYVFSPQHKGLGKKLIQMAEKITKKEFDLSKIAVISAVGTRDYFAKLGYQLRDTYMLKSI